MKRQHGGSLEVSDLETPVSTENRFEESLKSGDCVKVLVNCMSNLEK